ncbi:hypothetical protein Taro_017264 [Colocasia esculenta]|uniref:RNase H type-1 domain-containing protein n=1 Tax=Colocasia esculenta TaxID=4460 RepID=A0A843UVH1_COLES|nr:hypothetical protein [Colocasia esculenta]
MYWLSSRCCSSSGNTSSRRIRPSEVQLFTISELGWVLGNGASIKFLDDVWIGKKPLKESLSSTFLEPSPTIREVLLDQNHHLCSIIPHDLDQLQLSSHKDICVLAATNKGTFTLKSAYDQVRSHGVKHSPFYRIWHRHFSRRASMFSWLLLHRAVPVDDHIAECGINLPSHCCCCRRPHVEDMNHLFVHSDLAKGLWLWVSPVLHAGHGIHMNISLRLWDIIKSCSLTNPHDFITIYCSMLIVWEVWKIRCKMKFEQVKYSSNLLRQNIHALVTIAIENMVFNDAGTPQQMEAIVELGFFVQPIVKLGKLVRWFPPLQGLALNIDGASKGNPSPCGGGGLVRNAYGTVVLALSHFYAAGTSLLAEAQAMCDGVQLAVEQGIFIAEIYSDSMTLVNSFRTGLSPSWDCHRWWRFVLDFVHHHGVRVSHVYREANQVADALANFA